MADLTLADLQTLRDDLDDVAHEGVSRRLGRRLGRLIGTAVAAQAGGHKSRDHLGGGAEPSEVRVRHGRIVGVELNGSHASVDEFRKSCASGSSRSKGHGTLLGTE